MKKDPKSKKAKVKSVLKFLINRPRISSQNQVPESLFMLVYFMSAGLYEYRGSGSLLISLKHMFQSISHISGYNGGNFRIFVITKIYSKFLSET